MVEFPNLGKYCSFKDCQQLDFLPFVCDRCKRVYCLEHRDYQAHKCDNVFKNEAPACPLCHQVLTVPKDEDINVVMNRHIEEGCPEVKREKTMHPCSVSHCKNTEIVPIYCDNCRRKFCFMHRFPEQHHCPSLPKVVDSRPRHSHVGRSVASWRERIQERLQNLVKLNNPQARAVNLMKKKHSAIGNSTLPMERRYYLEIIYPLDSKVEPKMMFFDPNQSIGKVLDLAANAANISDDPQKGQLHLIALSTGEPLPNNQLLKDVKILHSGDSVLLEWLES
jgi:predicted nucleic acid binding AN1-type Zn finger protein